MLRIDADRYTILYISEGDKLHHRYAVESHFTCGNVGRRAHESLTRRSGENEHFSLKTERGLCLSPNVVIADVFRDGDFVSVVSREEYEA